MVRKRDASLLLLVVAQVILGTHSQALSVNPAECRSLMDLYIVIDGSDSISFPDFQTLQEAIASLVYQIDIGPNRARLGMLVYSTDVPKVSVHPFYDNPIQLVEAAMTLNQPRDGTHTNRGLKRMRAMFQKYGRPDVPWVCVTITDGISKSRKNTRMEAKLAEKMGINMIAVGVGQNIDLGELRDIGSSERQVITLTNFNQLADMLTSVMTTICPCSTPPPVPLAKCADGPRAIGSVRHYQCQDGYLQRGNPQITCLDDSTWSSLSPDFECAACSEVTPTVTYGSCGGGGYTIGTVRTFTCDHGYLAVGAGDIVCQADAMWSIPQIQCVPCGDTPVVTHGTCGGGDYTIGAKRIYTCNKGYLGVGSSEIVCQGNAKWSTPAYKCVSCPDTPVIQHGTCGGGDYTLGAKRQYTCDKGYLGVGSSEIVCQGNAKWSTPAYKCVSCPDTPVIQHGTCGGGDYTLGAKRQYKCDKGYLGVGSSEIVCQGDAQWTTPAYKCVSCPDTPVIKHGTCGGGEYTLGARRQYTCDKGYLGLGSPEIVCQDNAHWSISNFQCTPCLDTPVVEHGKCGGGNFTLGSRRYFTCDTGYLAVGNSEIVCQDNALWSEPQIKCTPCGVTPVIDHGSCGGGDFTLGSRRQFTCDTGYLAVGNSEIVCQDNALWSEPQIKCTPCGATPVIDHGSCGGGDFTLGSRRQFTCDTGYLAVGNSEIFCQDNALWSEPQIKCTPCGATPVIDHGSCGGGDFTLGSRRHFTCNTGYLAVGNSEIFCQDNALWSEPQIKCTPCGATPVIDHGSCGGGDFTLGSRRQFTCDTGYLAIGNSEIVCQDNALWSEPQIKCTPCGATPVIDHGSCGGGNFTLGSRRHFTCNTGYLAVGNSEIFCQDNALWSEPQIKCTPCGATPVIDHGSCGGGEFTLGSRRHFTCDTGYLAVGNSEIVCQDNALWSEPQIKCTPCGATPVVDHGTCGGGDHIIGSRRSFTCDPGYFLKGNADIVCQKDAKWSVADLVCIPCDSQTPEVPNAVCGTGDILVGSTRTYTCNHGYIAKGNPNIKCRHDATWSKPAFTCKDCGAPPEVPYAFTGLGPSTIGGAREYHCEAGYEMVGRGQITCRPNGKWEQPSFSCNVKTTTTTTTPTPDKADPSICDHCRYHNGVGYAMHPFDCSQYVQCYVGGVGMAAFYRPCPFGQFWDQNVLTCRPSHLVDCPNDKCASPGVNGYKSSDPNNCCSYWKCQNGKSYGECCGEGYSYHAGSGQCVHDDTCYATCPYEDEIQACTRRPVRKDTMYEQHIGGGHWVMMPCAPGTAYNPVDCECSLTIMKVPGKRRQQVCKPELYLPFRRNAADRSGKNVYVKTENVEVRNGSAYFNGYSRLMISRFSNTEFYGHLVIKFRYREHLVGPTAHKLQALVTNGDCGSDPSIIIAKMPGYVLLGAKTQQPRSFALPTLDKEWKEVIYIHNEKRLESKVCGATGSKWSYGPIQATHCALQIGYGNGLENFIGDIDDLYIYQCRPRASILNIDY